MAFSRPTLPALQRRVEADFDTHIENADTKLPLNLPAIDSTVHAGATHELHGAIAAQEKKLLPIDGDEETVLKWAEMKGLLRLAATFSTGQVTHTGATDGSVVPQGTRMQSGSAQIYIVQADATVAAGQVTLSVTAEAAGVTANAEAGSKLNFVSPVPGVPAEGIVGAAGILGGADQESVIPSLLERLLFEFQKPPRGGSADDYIRWAKAAHPSVTRVFVNAHERGAGTIVVRFTTDNDVSIIPAAQIVTTVRDYILQRAPVDARNIFIEAPIPVPRDIAYTSLTPNTVAVQTAINLELQDLFRRQPKPAIRVPDSKITESSSVAQGEEDHAFTSSSIALAIGEIEILGAVTWPAP